jgi:hypothetical protein
MIWDSMPIKEFGFDCSMDLHWVRDLTKFGAGQGLEIKMTLWLSAKVLDGGGQFVILAQLIDTAYCRIGFFAHHFSVSDMQTVFDVLDLRPYVHSGDGVKCFLLKVGWTWMSRRWREVGDPIECRSVLLAPLSDASRQNSLERCRCPRIRPVSISARKGNSQ